MAFSLGCVNCNCSCSQFVEAQTITNRGNDAIQGGEVVRTGCYNDNDKHRHRLRPPFVFSRKITN